jgi:hypothetical protein
VVNAGHRRRRTTCSSAGVSIPSHCASPCHRSTTASAIEPAERAPAACSAFRAWILRARLDPGLVEKCDGGHIENMSILRS